MDTDTSHGNCAEHNYRSLPFINPTRAQPDREKRKLMWREEQIYASVITVHIREAHTCMYRPGLEADIKLG